MSVVKEDWLQAEIFFYGYGEKMALWECDPLLLFRVMDAYKIRILDWHFLYFIPARFLFVL